eukprot:403373553
MELHDQSGFYGEKKYLTSYSNTFDQNLQLNKFVDIPSSKIQDFQQYIKLQQQCNDKYELRRKREEILKLSTNFPSVCLIGVTGHGKSTTANMLVGEKEYFKTSSMIKSQTTSCSGVVRNWFGDPNQSQLLVLDTPGLGDSESRDSNHIANMVQSLKSVGYVNTFLLVINSQEPRFNEMLKESFKIFESMFGGDFYKNIQFCFTRFFYNQSLIRIRERGFQMTESEIIQQFRERFYAHFNYYLTLKQFIFIDNMLFIDPDDDYSLLEQLKFKEAKNRIKTFTMNNDIFLCQDIKQVQKENDRIKQDIEELMIKNEREIKTLQEEFDLKLGMQKKKNLDQQIKMQEKFKIDQQKLKQEQKEQAEKALQENKKLKEENSGLREMKCGLQLLPPKPTPSSRYSGYGSGFMGMPLMNYDQAPASKWVQWSEIPNYSRLL